VTIHELVCTDYTSTVPACPPRFLTVSETRFRADYAKQTVMTLPLHQAADLTEFPHYAVTTRAACWQKREEVDWTGGERQSEILTVPICMIQSRGRTNMKFMITYSFSADKFLPAVKAWSSMSPQERADVGDGVKLIGRWQDVVGRRAVGIVESNDLAAVSRFCGRWNSLGDCVITPVLDDEESAAAARQIAADHKA
jgi:hypothetical protein